MLTLTNGQYVFIGEIVDLMDKGSPHAICSGKVRKFIEVRSNVRMYIPSLR